MNLIPMNQSMSTELLLETPTGNLLSSLDEATRARVLGEPCMKYPLVIAEKKYGKIIQQRLMMYSYFDVEQGRFIRTKITQGIKKLGPMGYVNDKGYIKIQVLDNHLKQSQLVYLWFTGLLLKAGEMLDHIDGNTGNDHPGNLRVVSRSVNLRNSKISRNNTSGYTGVTYNKRLNCYIAQTNTIYHGCFSSAESAYAARQAYIKAHPELGFTSRHGT